ncbi:tyrosine-type recombinase/integrase [Amycolatopsis rifamycinica]|uniref:tyrosine-type recombinase/integrase n=1 Tax=Amycolatopsis rifamycinica TaxID=287986 RepID=UPI000A063864|nr:tyrosine-type recombinase/integrase [Amycolatopsis rifamycinica]
MRPLVRQLDVRSAGDGQRLPRQTARDRLRRVPHPDEVASARHWVALVDTRAEAKADGRPLASPIFASTTGTLRDPNNVLRVLREIRGSDDFLWLTSHNFRKTTATALDDAGVPTRLIADHLGHSRVSMTQDTYLGRKTVDPITAQALEGLLDKPSDPNSGDNPGSRS